jgi:hypothetical protein
MGLIEGKEYVTRNGGKVTVYELDAGGVVYPVRAVDSEGYSRFYTPTGAYLREGTPCDRDIIEPSIPEHRPYPKVYRLLDQKIEVTEKIDGTNGVIYISEDLSVVMAGSRNRWVTIGDDNAGFAAWVKENEEDLKILGPGFHYGEWWGKGIQRGYDMDKKVFSLFNPNRYSNKPACCDVVPILFSGTLLEWLLKVRPEAMHDYSEAAQKYDVLYNKTEGAMIYLKGTDVLLKDIWDK